MMNIKFNITKDLKAIKRAELKQVVFETIKGWKDLVNDSKTRNEFRDEFLSDEQTQYFMGLKDLVVEFEDLEEISVSLFLYGIVCGVSENFPIKELHKEFYEYLKTFEDYK